MFHNKYWMVQMLGFWYKSSWAKAIARVTYVTLTFKAITLWAHVVSSRHCFFIDAYRSIDNHSKLQNIDRRGPAFIPLPAICVHYSKQENWFHRRQDPRHVLVGEIKSATLSNTTGEICINMNSKAPVFHLYHSHPFSKYSALVGAFWKKFTSGLYIFWLAIAFQNVLQ